MTMTQATTLIVVTTWQATTTLTTTTFTLHVWPRANLIILINIMRYSCPDIKKPESLIVGSKGRRKASKQKEEGEL